MLYIYPVIFVVCFCATMWKIKTRRQEQILVSILWLLTLSIGLRSLNWPDTEVYVMSFNYAPDIFHVFQGEPYGYAEYGYYAICCFIKTFTDSWRVYLLMMAGLSMWLLHKNLKDQNEANSVHQQNSHNSMLHSDKSTSLLYLYSLLSPP